MASFTHEPGWIASGGEPKRPVFNALKTSDRLRESEFKPRMGSKLKSRRQSIFTEEGLEDLDTSIHPSHPAYEPLKSDSDTSPTQDTKDLKASSDTTRTSTDTKDGSDAGMISMDSSRWYSKFYRGSRPAVKSSSTAPPGPLSSLPRVALITFLVAIIVPGFRYSSSNGQSMMGGVDAGAIRTGEMVDNGSVIEGRANSPTDVCRRWAHQSANINGTLYIYGGQTKTSSGQTTDTWNNNLLALDLTKSWEKTSPALTGLPQPSGPPAVAMGALWNSYNSLFVYGGYFSDKPPVEPLPLSVWEYDIRGSKWIEHANPTTSAGNGSEPEGQEIQRSAEGAGLSVPEIGRSWYFGGHLDEHTTPGWSNQIWRIYLKGSLEFTHPGYANTGIDSLGSTKAAGIDGVYRNITEGGLQDTAGFEERADGTLVYIPGWGTEGILLGLAGGTNETFTEMNNIDVYDIANSTWYKQSTSGESPPRRVNPCSVVAAAPDGTSFNVYMYGGQNLIPQGEQTQYDDIWILTIPSFTWIEVNQDGQSKPAARAGHTCTLWDSQMVVVGGYVGQDIPCDSPGMYVFNTSSLQWSNSFTSLSSGGGSGSGSGSSSGGDENDDENKKSSIVQGSFGYQVPDAVQSVIGGGSTGGATATQPAAGSATRGPIATGKPPTFTITQSGSTVYSTSAPTGGSNPVTSGSSGGSKTNVGAIAAGVAAAVLAALAAYLAFCTWLYRKQLNIYKDHVAMGQRRNLSPGPWGAAAGNKNSSEKSGAAMLGPFGTDISNSGPNSAGRPSVGSSHNTGVASSSKRASSSNRTPSSNGPPDPAVFGGGSMPGGGIAGKGYSYGAEPYIRLSEDQEFLQKQHSGAQTPYGRQSSSTARSSTEDLIGGLEPTFFSVMLNPRRTLKVVNSD